MAAMSDYLENKLVDHIFRGTAYATPTTVYVALFQSGGAPSDSGGGSEVSGTGYTRIQVGPTGTHWNATQGGTSGVSSGTGGLTDNAGQITFGSPTANWGSITHFGIFDATTAGNLLFHGSLTTPKTVNNGDPAPYFAAGALDVTFA